METSKKQLKISEILSDLESGLTRLAKDDYGNGSIEGKYGLTFSEIRELFLHPKLKNRKTRRIGEGLSFELVDDTEVTEVVTDDIKEEVKVENSIEEEETVTTFTLI